MFKIKLASVTSGGFNNSAIMIVQNNEIINRQMFIPQHLEGK